MERIGLGGGCHWCTEAVFQSLIGVSKVEQGFIAPKYDPNSFSEAVIVHYDQNIISLKDLIEIHLLTHKSTVLHSMRAKYRSAIYAFNSLSLKESESQLGVLQKGFSDTIVTALYCFGAFKPSDSRFHNYYYKDPEKPFCETYISPKLKLLLDKFSVLVNPNLPSTFHEST
ncbi:MAG: peptide-methionine (S)-S-oxide reductase [Bacteroidota bacterium]